MRRRHPARRLACLVAQCHLLGLAVRPCDAFTLRPSIRYAPNAHQHHIARGGDSTASAFVRRRAARATPRKPSANNSDATSLCSTTSPDTTDNKVASTEDGGEAATATEDADLQFPWIIQWRGEGTEGYSESLREWEFTSAFKAEVADQLENHEDGPALSPAGLDAFLDDIQFTFRDSLTYRGPVYDPANTDEDHLGGEPIPLAQVKTYDSAMQYASIRLPSGVREKSDEATLAGIIQRTVRRCSLVRTAFQIAAEGSSFEELANIALQNGVFGDIMKGGANEDATWAIRLRRYGPVEEGGSTDTTRPKNASRRHARYGKNVRSPLRDEREAILSMKDLVMLFCGKVNLANPDCKIYLLEGLKGRSAESACVDGNILLARAIARGPKTSIYAPKTRICVTTTPLCPIASFALCNVARLRSHQTILDPFAGSCATLLAAAHIGQSFPGGCQSVGVEIAHNGFVSRPDILKDFETRSLPPPTDIIRGDCLSPDVRDQARSAIGGEAFDIIVTDPPYGIREAMSSDEDNGVSPLTQLFYAIGQDRASGTPLLKAGGRLVAFVPVQEGQCLEYCLPDLDARKAAGLVMDGEGKEQVLSDILSRWLVSFVSVC
ncbi:hypothetical protein ACHAXT_001505 [Thalassiosira profunda]